MTTYFLVDLENIPQPALPEKFPEDVHIWIFVGHGQTKIPLDLAERLQGLGERVRYIRIGRKGPNALDFHIACYAGRLSVGEPGAEFVIVSGDTGYDPLIVHLRELQIRIRRTRGETGKKVAAGSKSKAAVPSPPASAVKSAAGLSQSAEGVSQWEFFERVLKKLESMPGSRPRSLRTFSNLIRDVMQAPVSDEVCEELLGVFVQRGLVQNESGKLAWDYSRAIC